MNKLEAVLLLINESHKTNRSGPAAKRIAKACDVLEFWYDDRRAVFARLEYCDVKTGKPYAYGKGKPGTILWRMPT